MRKWVKRPAIYRLVGYKIKKGVYPESSDIGRASVGDVVGDRAVLLHRHGYLQCD